MTHHNIKRELSDAETVLRKEPMTTNYEKMIQKNLSGLFEKLPPDLETRLGDFEGFTQRVSEFVLSQPDD